MPRGSYSKKPIGVARPERAPGIRSQWEANKKIVLATQSICAICGKPVDKSLKFPDPMSPTVDHIIPVSKHGDPTDLDNLQLAHRICNRLKSDKLVDPLSTSKVAEKNTQHFYQSANWRTD